MISKDQFRQKCSTLIDEKEVALYKKKKTKRNTALAITLPIEIVVAIIIAILLGGRVWFMMFPILPAMITISLVIIFACTRFNWDEYKEKYIYGILALLLDGYKYNYNHSGFIASDVYEKSPYGEYYHHYNGEDMININIPNDDNTPSNVVLHMSDLDITKTIKDSDGDSHTVTVFSGCFGYVEFPFNFKCAIGIDHCYANKKLTRLKTEDIAFNKNLKIYTDNELEALVVLSPKMMEKLNNFKSKSGGFSLVIYDNKLYIHLYKNLFEIKSPKDEFNEKIFDDIYDDVNCILSLINEIQNNNKIFKM